MTTIIFHATKTRKSNRTFGLGLARPTAKRPRRTGPSDADRSWASYELNKDCRDYFLADDANAELDRRAAQAEADAKVESGFYQF